MYIGTMCHQPTTCLHVFDDEEWCLAVVVFDVDVAAYGD